MNRLNDETAFPSAFNGALRRALRAVRLMNATGTSSYDINLELGYGGARVLDVDWFHPFNLTLWSAIAREASFSRQPIPTINVLGSSAGNAIVCGLYMYESVRRICCGSFDSPPIWLRKTAPADDQSLFAIGDGDFEDRPPPCVCRLWSVLLRVELRRLSDGARRRLGDDSFCGSYAHLFRVNRFAYLFALCGIEDDFQTVFARLLIRARWFLRRLLTKKAREDVRTRTEAAFCASAGRCRFFVTLKSKRSDRIYRAEETIEKGECGKFVRLLFDRVDSRDPLLFCDEFASAANRIALVLTASIDFLGSFLPSDLVGIYRPAYLLPLSDPTSETPSLQRDETVSRLWELLDDREVLVSLLQKSQRPILLVDCIDQRGRAPSFCPLDETNRKRQWPTTTRITYDFVVLLSKNADRQLKSKTLQYLACCEDPLAR